VFSEFSKLNNETSFEVLLVSRSQQRASMTLKVERCEVFLS
jgi:hypothetical protein